MAGATRRWPASSEIALDHGFGSPAAFVADLPPLHVACMPARTSDVPGGRYAIGAFVGTAREIEGVWDRVFAGWLPGSGYQPDDRPCYELYRGAPSVPGRPGVFRCELHLPIRRL